MRIVSALFLVATACAGAPASPAQSPASPAAPSPGAPAGEPAPARETIKPAAVPKPPLACAALVAHPVKGCAPAGDVRLALSRALEKDGEARDAALACLEEKTELTLGFVRALRAELGPEACADALVTPLLERPPGKLTADRESVLFGLVVSGRLARLLEPPPALEAPFTKERFTEFLKNTLSRWVVAQSLAIDELSLQGSRLSGYGRAVAAIAAGNADLRFVEMVRKVPLPVEIQGDKELSDVYYGALDQALEPRKARGRDAALVGLRGFAELGAVRDARIARARALLSELYAGSQVDALDRLILPELAAVDSASPERVLARTLPTYYASEALAGVELGDVKLMRALLERGVPAPLAAGLDAKKLSPAARTLLAHGFVRSGVCYFRAADFRRAREALEAAPGKLDEAGTLLVAVARALETGPGDTAELMLKGPGARGAFDVSGLDAVAQKKGRFAGAAAFDAAFLTGLTPKPGDPVFWDGLAARFDGAQKLLGSEKVARNAKSDAYRARQYAEAARATAQALRQNQ